MRYVFLKFLIVPLFVCLPLGAMESSVAEVKPSDGVEKRFVFYDSLVHGKIDVIDAFINEALPTTPDIVSSYLFDGNAPIHIAASFNQQKVVEVLLAHGADINQLNNLGQSALHKALAAPVLSVEFINYLKKHGIKAGVYDKQKRTELHIVAARCYTALIYLFRCNRLTLSRRDKKGRTPLHEVVLRGCGDENFQQMILLAQNAAKKHDRAVETAQILLDKGAPLELCDKRDKTVSHYAAYIGDYDLIDLFIRHHGSLPNKKDLNGITPYVILFYNYRGIERNVRSLGFLGMKVHPLLLGDILRSLKIVQGKLRNKRGKTILHYVSRNKNLSVLKNLLPHVLDVQARDLKLRTALHHAVRVGFKKGIECLLEAGVDPRLQDQDGCTPLISACREGRWGIAALLFAKSTDLMHIADSSGITPADVIARGVDKDFSTALRWIFGETVAQEAREKVIELILLELSAFDGAVSETMENTLDFYRAFLMHDTQQLRELLQNDEIKADDEKGLLLHALQDEEFEIALMLYIHNNDIFEPAAGGTTLAMNALVQIITTALDAGSLFNNASKHLFWDLLEGDMNKKMIIRVLLALI